MLKKQLDAVLRENLANIEHILGLSAAVTLGHLHRDTRHSNGVPDCQVQANVAVEGIRQCIELAGSAKSALSSIVSLLENGSYYGKKATQNAIGIKSEGRDAEAQEVDFCNIKNPQKNAAERIMDVSVGECSCEDHNLKSPSRAVKETGNPCLQNVLSSGADKEEFFVDKKQFVESSEVSKEMSGTQGFLAKQNPKCPYQKVFCTEI